ncbi:hypothetical protein NN3_05380 [Nocardia neocaledoniensis NBRC 108232]|uniref:DNA-directed RNA polymerase specialized sigma24 family protein n=1 Tax=Nocardia neocaledoniensis TaxID=236511 RepID=A0A317NXF3_9NOCA|nr:hypothetical protein [Nocardia neocaledoniensis]PWV79665.1 hypothetical protein DFR69_102731 [Nocardia neocaledoniensis]GEM29531.1 hypothetical protein NN3_05380 [Nocardia neocaledoniensis NBRC 108232]
MTNSRVANYRGPAGISGSPLAVAWAGFDRLAHQTLPADPHPLPPALVAPIRTWGQLREQLWDPATPMAEVDAIWVWLLRRVRAEGDDAMLVCAGLAAPMLSRTASEYVGVTNTARHDIESEILTAFLTHLPRVGLDEPGVWHRLRWGAYRAVLKAATQQRTGATVVGDIDADLAGAGQQVRAIGAGPGHPEAVLTQAVAAGVISADAAELIAATRWEGRSLTALAAERGVSLWKLRKARPRAERALLAWLSDRARDIDPDRTSTVEAEAVTALTPPDRSPRRGRRPNRHSVTPTPSSTEHGQVAA